MMAEPKIALLELLRNAGVQQPEFLREGLEQFLQAVIEAEVAARVGADRYERSEERAGYRNGSRQREWETRLGTVDLQIPKLVESVRARRIDFPMMWATQSPHIAAFPSRAGEMDALMANDHAL